MHFTITGALSVLTTICIIIYFVFVLFNAEHTPTISSMITEVKAANVFMTLVFLHSIQIVLYLTVLFETVSKWFFGGIVIVHFIYLLFLYIVVFLPVDKHDYEHNAIAIVAFMFAWLSNLTDWSRDTFNTRMFNIVEGICTMTLLILFGTISTGEVFEYLFIGYMLMSKYVKVIVLASQEEDYTDIKINITVTKVKPEGETNETELAPLVNNVPQKKRESKPKIRF